jgi:hypothetical protein
MERLTVLQGSKTPKKKALFFLGYHPVGMQGQMEPRLSKVVFHKMVKEMLNLVSSVLMVQFPVECMSDFVQQHLGNGIRVGINLFPGIVTPFF